MAMKPRNDYELKLMRKSGEITARALKKALNAVKVGVNLLEIEKIAWDEIIRLGGKISFAMEPGYKWATCLTINEEVVHGIPRDIVLKDGDVFSIDIGAVYKGWHTDAAWSVIVGESEDSKDSDESKARKRKFLEVGEKAMWNGISKAASGNRVGDIANAIQTEVEGNGGYKVVRSLVGHGVGKHLHEEPEVPGFGKAGTGPILKKGMTIAIEAIYTESTPDVVLAADNWTISSADGSLGGLFEMSVIVLDGKAEVLTDWRKF